MVVKGGVNKIMEVGIKQAIILSVIVITIVLFYWRNMNIESLQTFTNDTVIKIIPQANKTYVKRYWPIVLMALNEQNIDDAPMVLMALGTIAAETGNFDICIREYVSRYNTSPQGRKVGHTFDLYDTRSDLGNLTKGDGYDYRGGGAIQLTGRYNFREIGKKMNVPLDKYPELINNPIISARALALFLKGKQTTIRRALGRGDLKEARRLVNGGSHGLDRFTETYNRGLQFIN